MPRKPTIMIRPLEPQDHALLLRWSRMRDWPTRIQVELGTKAESSQRRVRHGNGEAILMAEPPGLDPIGLAQLSTRELPHGIAQYSVAIPDPKNRRVGWGRDTLVLTIGAAFYVYCHRQIFSLVEADNRQLIGMCFKAGFWEETDFSFLGYGTPAQDGVRIFRTSAARWMRVWGAELASKVTQVPWFNANASWAALMHMQQKLRQSEFDSDAPAEDTEGAPLDGVVGGSSGVSCELPTRKVFIWDVETSSV